MSDGENRERIYAERVKKLQEMRAAKIEPYPARVDRSHTIGAVIEEFTVLGERQTVVQVVGRTTARREHGKIAFFDIVDETGKIQVFLQEKKLGVRFKEIMNSVDLGDFIGVQGICFTTKKGEKTIEASEVVVLSKSLLPLPTLWYGLKEKEERYRKRYLDLMLNQEIKDRFTKRSLIMRELRSILDGEGFLEVETPILQSLYGGANAKPFTTHLNFLDKDVFLRIAPELYLKRLIVGGYEKVYEVSKNFRNEGIDKNHNPEFTSLELYWAFHDDQELMALTERVVEELVKRVNGGSTVVTYQDHAIDFKTPWRRVNLIEEFTQKVGLDPLKATEKELLQKCKDLKIIVGKKPRRDSLVDELYKKTILPELTQPTFIHDIPTVISPLAKQYADKPEVARRFQGIIAGMECMNAFAELNDPIEQEKRFTEESEHREDPHPIDKDFIEALSYGMPPCAGLGIGLDRLIMILTNAPNIKEVIFFPFMREKE